MAKLKPGMRVRRNMGIHQSGTVIAPFDWTEADDGTYRAPMPEDGAVWVRWDDGTRGWIPDVFLFAA